MKSLAIGACLLLGGFVTARAVLVPLTYDEAASYLRYISQDVLAVFNFEVATNHFLNTLPTKFVASIGGDNELVLRIPSLIGYGLYLHFSVLILRGIAHRPIAIAGFALLHLNPYLLDYFALSRGYGLSLGLLMGALFFLLRFASRRHMGGDGRGDVSRALMFACGAVVAGFSLLDAYLGIFAVLIVLMRMGRKPGSQEAGKPGSAEAAERSAFRSSRLPGFQTSWLLFTTAALFTFLVLSQDHRLTDQLYEPVTLSFVGLDPTELDAIAVSRINLRRRPEAVPREPGGSVWRVDPPVAIRGLRAELPASAAEKIVDDRAFIETVIGSRPFLQRRGQDGIWSVRGAGAASVFESGPSLSLARAWMGLYEPVINWRGDRRHLGWVAAYTAIVLVILVGLAGVLGLAGWILQRGGILWAAEWRPLMFGMLWLAALAGTPLYLLRRGGELYFGGERGFIEDTIYSLIENSFYGRTYFADQVDIVFGAIAGAGAAFVVVAYVSWRRGAVHDVMPAGCLFGVLIVASAAVISQNRLLETPFLLGRTALFYIPVFAVFAAFVCDAMARLGPAGRTLAVALSVAGATLATGHFGMTANVSYTWDWKRDAGTKAMIDDLARVIAEERIPGARVVLGVEPGYSAAAAFYAQKCRTATIEMDTIPSPRGIDFFYVDERNVGSSTVIKRYPVAQSVLARPSRPR